MSLTRLQKLRIRTRERHLANPKHCGRGKGYLKWAYPNLLMALGACERLRKLGGHINPLHIYHCMVCQGMHIGHLGSEESMLMYEGIAIDIREEQGL